MMYGSWDMERNRQDFLSFWTDFCPFTPYGPRKSKFLKHQKKTGRYYHFTNVYHKRQSYDVLFLRYGLQRTESFAFFAFLPPPPPLTTRKINIFKEWKKVLKISFYICVPKMTIIWCMVPEILSAKIFCHFELFFALLRP